MKESNRRGKKSVTKSHAEVDRKENMLCVFVCVWCTYMEYQTPRSYPSTKALNKLQGLSEPNLLEIQSKV